MEIALDDKVQLLVGYKYESLLRTYHKVHNRPPRETQKWWKGQLADDYTYAQDQVREVSATSWNRPCPDGNLFCSDVSGESLRPI